MTTTTHDMSVQAAARQEQKLRPATLLITTESLGPINGVTNATSRLLNHLDQYGVRPVVLAPQTPRSIETPAGTRVVRLRGLPVPYNPELRLVNPLTAWNALRGLPRPDVLYAASPATLGFEVWWQLRGHNVPTVVNYQTDLSAYARQIMPGPFGPMGGGAIDALTHTMLAHPTVKTVLVPSRASQSYLESIGIPADKMVRLGRGVDCALFSPARRNPALRQRHAPNGETLLLCVSRLSLEKGFAFLARAYRALCEARPADAPPFRLIITGGNSNPLIESQIHDLFAGLDVVFTGVLTGAALAEMYASADAFVFPSVTETFGQVIQEAMASALPVVALNRGGPADLVLPDATGYLCAPDEPQAVTDFVHHTSALLDDPARRARFGQTALAIARTRDWESVNALVWRTIVAATG